MDQNTRVRVDIREGLQHADHAVKRAALRMRAIVAACGTAAIDVIERDATADTAACGLLRWGHLRVNALQVLLQLAGVEVRRYHGTLDGERVVHWAHLLVCFVEAFKHGIYKVVADGVGFSVVEG